MRCIISLLMIALYCSAAFGTTESIVVATNSGTILTEDNGNLVRPIASISKLLIAVLASKQDLDEMLIVPKKRTVHSIIPVNQHTMSRKSLLTLSLVKSDNFAAQIICDNLENCILEANKLATDIGMRDTNLVEPTGLSKENVSTANDLLKLLIVAANDETISNLSKMPFAEIQAGKSKLKIQNTNPLTKTLDVILSKTGFTNPAGGCMVLVVNSELGKKFFILLGSKNTRTRVTEMNKLYKDYIVFYD